MRSIALLGPLALLVPACMLNEPQAVEYYDLSIDGDSSALVLNTRPNFDNQVKRIVGTAADGTAYVVDLCLGVTSGNAENPIVAEDVMVCVGEGNATGNIDNMWGCYDGRTTSVKPSVNVTRKLVQEGVTVLTGDVGVVIPNFGGDGSNVDLTTDFQVRVNDAPASDQPTGGTFNFPWGGNGWD